MSLPSGHCKVGSGHWTPRCIGAPDRMVRLAHWEWSLSTRPANSNIDNLLRRAPPSRTDMGKARNSASFCASLWSRIFDIRNLLLETELEGTETGSTRPCLLVSQTKRTGSGLLARG